VEAENFDRLATKTESISSASPDCFRIFRVSGRMFREKPVAPLQGKLVHPEAPITYVRRLNKHGDQRHPERDFKQTDEKR
jgi:hypothetical protein